MKRPASALITRFAGVIIAASGIAACSDKAPVGTPCSVDNSCPGGTPCVSGTCVPESCTGNAECPAGWLCLQSDCAEMCINTADCTRGCCINGQCADPCPTAAPVIADVDGTGSPDVTPDHASYHLDDRIIVTGQHLTGATFQLANAAGGTAVLAHCDVTADTDDRVALALPTAIAVGEYTLTAVNQNQQVCSVGLHLLQGEPGGGVTIESSEITDGTIATADLAANAVTSAKIADGTITFADLGANACTANQVIKRDATNTEWVCAADAQRSEATVEGYIANDVATGFVPYDDGTKLTSSVLYATTGGVGVNTTNVSASLVVRGNSEEALTGTVTGVISERIVTGTGTSFNTQLQQGYAVLIGTRRYTVDEVTNNTHFTVTADLVETFAGETAYRDAPLFSVRTGTNREVFSIDRAGVPSIIVGGVRLVATLGNYGEDDYPAWAVGWGVNDTCDGSSSAGYVCLPAERTTCVDTLSGADDLRVRTVTCRLGVIFVAE